MNYMPGFSHHYFGSASISRGVPSTHKVRLILRDGPLEKLLRWGGGGGGGIFELHEFFC